MNEGLFPLSLLELKMISIKTVVDCVLRCNEEVDVVWMRICGGVFRFFQFLREYSDEDFGVYCFTKGCPQI